MLFSAVATERDGVATLSVVGECDLATVPRFRNEIVRASRSCASLVIDLSGLEFIDSIGLGVLIGARRRVDNLVVVCPSGRVRDVLAATSVDRILDIRDANDVVT